MDINQAIQILKTHNKWRRGAEIEPTNPTLLGEAIDLVVKYMEDQIVSPDAELAALQRIRQHIAGVMYTSKQAPKSDES